MSIKPTLDKIAAGKFQPSVIVYKHVEYFEVPMRALLATAIKVVTFETN